MSAMSRNMLDAELEEYKASSSAGYNGAPPAYEAYAEGMVDGEGLGEGEGEDAPKKKKRKKKKKKKNVDEFGNEIPPEAPKVSSVYNASTFRLGMNLNILLQEVAKNLTRAIMVYDGEQSQQFTDNEAAALAVELKHNTSLIGMNVVGTAVSDKGVQLMAEALHNHPRIRIVDFSQSNIGDKAGEALLALVRANTAVQQVCLENTLVSDEILLDIELASQYNELQCPDPTENPLRQEEEKVVCGHYMNGTCAYGSRCMHYHPERASMLCPPGEEFVRSNVSAPQWKPKARPNSTDGGGVSSWARAVSHPAFPAVVCGLCAAALVSAFVLSKR